MSPLQIKIVLHHYTTPAAWDGPRRVEDAPGFETLMKNGLLKVKECMEAGDSQYAITDKGTAYVHALLATPMPEQCWRLPGSDQIIWNPHPLLYADEPKP